jgi:hypothetical protein
LVDNEGLPRIGRNQTTYLRIKRRGVTKEVEDSRNSNWNEAAERPISNEP